MSPSPATAAVETASLVRAMGIAMARLPADAATPALKVSRVNYDPAGTDLRTNTMYNKETVTVTNTTGVARSLRGWTVRDNYVWNNTGDTAILRNSSRATVHSCKWTTLKPGYKIC